jgi:hypothetical protein
MIDKNKPPTRSLAGVSWNSLGAGSAKLHTPPLACAQCLVAAYGLSPELLTMGAPLVLGGPCHEI